MEICGKERCCTSLRGTLSILCKEGMLSSSVPSYSGSVLPLFPSPLFPLSPRSVFPPVSLPPCALRMNCHRTTLHQLGLPHMNITPTRHSHGNATHRPGPQPRTPSTPRAPSLFSCFQNTTVLFCTLGGPDATVNASTTINLSTTSQHATQYTSLTTTCYS